MPTYNVDIHKVNWYSQCVFFRRQTLFYKIARILSPLLVILFAYGAAPSASAPSRNAFRVAISVSPFTEILLESGIVYTDGTRTATTVEDLQRLFVAHGANEVYARIATTRSKTPGFGDHSLDRGLERARLAKSLGLPFNPELGLFAVYGDLRCQPSPDFSGYPELKVPAVWTSLTIEQMLPIVRSYGAIVAKMILDTGVQVSVWDLGNEVDLGIAGVSPRPMPAGCEEKGPGWYLPPDKIDPEIGKKGALDLIRMADSERIEWLQAHVWPYEARILAATADGIRTVVPSARFSTHASGFLAVHPADAVAFFSAMKKRGYLPDQLGFSFYPSSTSDPPDRMQAFKKTVLSVRMEFNRPVFIAEFAYPAAQQAAQEGPFRSWNHALDGYPLTPSGQADALRDLASWGAAHGVTGIRPWGPETTVAAWSSFALFGLTSKTATARPALDAIKAGAMAPKP